MAKNSDPTKEPEFQKVVLGFLKTKPTPHKSKRKARSLPVKRKQAGNRRNNSRDS